MAGQSKRQVLEKTTFGQRVAEDEAKELRSYFVETSQWQKIWAGDIDIVYGAKGSGKSAIYALLLDRKSELFDRGILVLPAENPRGTPVFKDLITDPPATENEFRGLWKIYFLTLIAGELVTHRVGGQDAKKVSDTLKDAELLPKEWNLRTILSNVIVYVRNLANVEAIENSVQFDPTLGSSTLSNKIVLREPSVAERKKGFISADTLLQHAQSALANAGLHIWLLLDRLDVAFADTPDLERNALQALFRVYLDLQIYDRVSLKIFLRDDIWQRITNAGFREASHIIRSLYISWNEQTLLNLIIRRALKNQILQEMYSVSEEEILRDAQKQEEFFYRMFPRQVDRGLRKPNTVDWILSRTRDGTKKTAPRELIHLLNSIRDTEIKHLEVGNREPPGELLFDRAAIQEALPEVSQARLEQTLYAEYPSLKRLLQKLEGKKTQQTPETLSAIWTITPEEASAHASQLVDIGFFERQETKGKLSYKVPFLYRSALHMVQGAAESADEE